MMVSLYAFSQSPMQIDLHQLVKNKKIDVYNRELTTFNEGSRSCIRLSKDIGEGVAWLNNLEFSNGTLEFDVRGEDLKQHSLLGLRFMAKTIQPLMPSIFVLFNFKNKMNY